MSERRLHNPYSYLFWGVVFVLGGAIWKLSLLGWFEMRWELLLPAILIVLGIAFLVSGFARWRPRPLSQEEGQEEDERL
ncbi:MAG: hypothetical protein RMJ96_07135 [Candidatus Bipolaricaulota bacterium]|nr:hypothetical protein [Candidatus Bipolaricaulota bacterium]MDW8111356.1 hypothetical protein [Candidatus Bipolaricaulota bacterium]MDW8329224.1 hypothetical protein [Candidatus Bipolaricaulota bacterium]